MDKLAEHLGAKAEDFEGFELKTNQGMLIYSDRDLREIGKPPQSGLKSLFRRALENGLPYALLDGVPTRLPGFKIWSDNRMARGLRVLRWKDEPAPAEPAAEDS